MIDDYPTHYFRVHPRAKWHRGLGKAAWCSTALDNRGPAVEWEVRRPSKNLCKRCFPDPKDE